MQFFVSLESSVMLFVTNEEAFIVGELARHYKSEYLNEDLVIECLKNEKVTRITNYVK